MKVLYAAVLVFSVSFMEPAVAADPDWYRSSFPLKAGNVLLNTATYDSGGHAAPFMADIDGDGRRDLTVGSIGGRFRFYRNLGSDSNPRFGERSAYLLAGVSADVPAQVPNFCCVASGPQIRDIDGDGILDLTSGSYSPGQVYWFKGLRTGKFLMRQTLTDTTAMPVLPCPEQNSYEMLVMENGKFVSGNLMVNLAWTDWDNNGSPDLILGNSDGQLFVRLNVEGVMKEGSPMPIPSQPQFMPKRFQQFNEIQIDGRKASPEGHCAPAVADWDGDGLWDILIGSDSGRVFWLKNTGKPGKPLFKDRQELLGPGSIRHWAEAGKEPGRGVRTQIQAVDYNLDGRMDLLVGDWSIIHTPRSDLTGAQRSEMERIRKELNLLDEKVGLTETGVGRYHAREYQQNKDVLKQAQVLEVQLARFLQKNESTNLPDEDYLQMNRAEIYTGHVWAFLGK